MLEVSVNDQLQERVILSEVNLCDVIIFFISARLHLDSRVWIVYCATNLVQHNFVDFSSLQQIYVRASSVDIDPAGDLVFAWDPFLQNLLNEQHFILKFFSQLWVIFFYIFEWRRNVPRYFSPIDDLRNFLEFIGLFKGFGSILSISPRCAFQIVEDKHSFAKLELVALHFLAPVKPHLPLGFNVGYKDTHVFRVFCWNYSYRLPSWLFFHLRYLCFCYFHSSFNSFLNNYFFLFLLNTTLAGWIW